MNCQHLFSRRPGWWWHRTEWERWECRYCGMTTRTYDWADRHMSRPIHPHMTVALPGYNTSRRT